MNQRMNILNRAYGTYPCHPRSYWVETTLVWMLAMSSHFFILFLCFKALLTYVEVSDKCLNKCWRWRKILISDLPWSLPVEQRVSIVVDSGSHFHSLTPAIDRRNLRYLVWSCTRGAAWADASPSTQWSVLERISLQWYVRLKSQRRSASLDDSAKPTESTGQRQHPYRIFDAILVR